MMNYSADKPITNKDDDLLGRAFFSKKLGQAIYNYHGQDGLVIGLYGEWGTGKTSVVNMVEEEINRLAENDKNKPLMIRFSPWNYSDKENLISLFFQSLKNKLEFQSDKQLRTKVGKALSDYAEAFDVLSVMPFMPIVGFGLASMVKSLIKASHKKRGDLDETRKNLEKALKTAKKKIVVVIDDIDRLTNTQIMDIFQLVKQVADFPNIIYLLVMDRGIVSEALAEVYKVEGDKYLEKIIQIPFELPILRKSDLSYILSKKLDELICNFPDKVVWNEKYYSSILSYCVTPYLNTLRDVNRLINVFQFRYGMLYQEISFEDMLGMTALEIFEPEVYKWIYYNKYDLCIGIETGRDPEDITNESYYKGYFNFFERMGIEKPDRTIMCIATMFSAFANDVHLHKYDYNDLKEYAWDYDFERDSVLRTKNGVSDITKFELYFMQIEDMKVPQSIINACLFEFGRDQLSEVIKENIKKDKEDNAVSNCDSFDNIGYLLENIVEQVDKIPYERLELIASTVLELQEDFEGQYSLYGFYGYGAMSTYGAAGYLVYHIIKRFETEEERYHFIRYWIENINKNKLELIAYIINEIEYSYGRFKGDKENKDKQIISLEQLKEVENSYVEKIRIISESESILDISDFNSIFGLWQFLDKEGAIAYLQDTFKDEVKTFKFLCKRADYWVSHYGNVSWVLDVRECLGYISKDEVYNIIQGFDKSKLEKFTEKEQIKLVSFIFNYNKIEKEYRTEGEVKELVNQWKEDSNGKLLVEILEY